MSPGEVAAIVFGTFAVLVILRIPVAFALGLACVPVFFISPRLTPSILFDQMFGSYNSFILLAVPFFLLAANDLTNYWTYMFSFTVKLCTGPRYITY